MYQQNPDLPSAPLAAFWGHDATGKGAQLPAAALGVMAILAKVADYVIVAPDDLDKLISVTTGTGNINQTLPTPAAAGAGAVVWIQKADNANGRVYVKTAAGTIIKTLFYRSHTVAFRVNAAVNGWDVIDQGKRRRPWTSGKYVLPWDGFGSAGLASGIVADRLKSFMFNVGVPIVIDAAQFYVGSNTPSAWQMKVAVFDYNPLNPEKPDGGPKMVEGGIVGNAGGVTAQSNITSVLGLATEMAQDGRGAVATIMSVATNNANQIYGSNGIGVAIDGADNAAEVMGFSNTQLKGFDHGANTFTAGFPSTLPASTHDVAGTPVCLLRVA